MPAARRKRLASRTPTAEQVLARTYFNAPHPASLGGINRLAKSVKQKPAQVQKWLEQQPTYALHKPVRYKFPRRSYMTRGVNEQWQADLVEMQHYSRINKGYRYILCVIDIFSRYAYARPIKSKSGPDVAAALGDILHTSGVSPKYLQTDQGLEFYNQHVKQLLARQGIELFSVYSEKKAAIVERFQRTLQDRMYRAFTYQANNHWLDLLPQLLDNYNHSYHRSIKTTPASVSQQNETDIWTNQYSKVVKPKPNAPTKFQVGDHVRIPKVRTVFKKGYLKKWTDEVFIIDSINTKYKPILYTLKDLNHDIIQGSFYVQELQRAVL